MNKTPETRPVIQGLNLGTQICAVRVLAMRFRPAFEGERGTQTSMTDGSQGGDRTRDNLITRNPDVSIGRGLYHLPFWKSGAVGAY